MAKTTGGAGTNKRLTKDELLRRLRPNTEEFQLPKEAGGGTILLRGLSGAQMFDEMKGLDDEKTLDRIKRLMLLGIQEPELDLDAVSVLGDSSAGLLERISNRIMTLSGFNLPGMDDFLARIQQQKESSSSASKS